MPLSISNDEENLYRKKIYHLSFLFKRKQKSNSLRVGPVSPCALCTSIFYIKRTIFYIFLSPICVFIKKGWTNCFLLFVVGEIRIHVEHQHASFNSKFCCLQLQWKFLLRGCGVVLPIVWSLPACVRIGCGCHHLLHNIASFCINSKSTIMPICHNSVLLLSKLNMH